MKKNLLVLFSIIILSAVIGLGVRFAIAQFTEPSTTPPGDNPLPIWVSLPNGNIYYTTGGNVGIGTTSPGVKLDVQGSLQVGDGNTDIWSTATDNFSIRTAGNTPNPNFTIGVGNGAGGWAHEPIFWNNYLRLRGASGAGANVIINDNGGNVGIGTTSPGAKLQIGSSGNIWSGGPQLSLNGPRGDGWPGVTLQFSPSATAGWHWNAQTNGDFYFHSFSGGTWPARVVFLENGNVGIGTTSPQAKLDVNGTLRVQGGSPAVGKVLTSDASGLASWQPSAPKLLYKGTQWTEEAIIELNSGGVAYQQTDVCCGGSNRVENEIINWPAVPSSVRKIFFVVSNEGDDYCVGGGGRLNIAGGRQYPYCYDHWYDGTSYRIGWQGNQDDWASLIINGRRMTNCPQAGPSSSPSSARYGHPYFDVGCVYTKDAEWSGDLSSFRIETADWSGSFSLWEIEIWYVE